MTQTATPTDHLLWVQESTIRLDLCFLFSFLKEEQQEVKAADAQFLVSKSEPCHIWFLCSGRYKETLLLPAMKEGFTSALHWGSTEQVEERAQGSWELFIDWWLRKQTLLPSLEGHFLNHFGLNVQTFHINSIVIHRTIFQCKSYTQSQHLDSRKPE